MAQFGGDIALHKMYLQSALNNMKIDVRSSILLIRKCAQQVFRQTTKPNLIGSPSTSDNG